MEESKDAHFPRKRLLHNSYILSILFSTAINQSFFFTRTPKHEVRENPPPQKKKKKKKKYNTTNGNQISVTHIID
jgi:hypothetical protein